MSGGGMGGGLGATLGTIAAAALAPETGGASLLVDAGLDATTAAAITGAGLGSIGGAAGGALGAAVSGGDPGKAAESGGIGGFLGGGVSGLLGGSGDAIAGTTADSLKAGADASAAPVDATSISGASDAGVSGGSSAGVSGGSSAGVSGGGVSGNLGIGASGADTGASGTISDSSGLWQNAPTASSPTDTAFMNGQPLPQNVPNIGQGPTVGATPPAADAPNAFQRFYANHAPEFLGGNPSTGGSGGFNPISGGGGSGNNSSSGGIPDIAKLGIGLAGINALMGPGGSNPVNTGPMSAAQAAFNAPLPKYNYNSVSTPYTGNWYTYGQRPQGPMVQNTVTHAARGGLIGYAQGGQVSGEAPVPLHKPLVPPLRELSISDIMAALPKGVASNQPQHPMPQPVQSPRGEQTIEPDYAQGGRVRALAMGGPPMQAPMAPPPAMPPQGMLPRPAGMPPQGGMQQALKNPNPRQAAAQHEIGRRIGAVLRQRILSQGKTPAGAVNGAGKGQDDAIPAKLSAGEYVIPADSVSMLGDGSTNAGAKQLDQMVTHIRAHKTSHGSKFPPKAKSPLSYIGKR